METEKKYWFGILPHVYYVKKGRRMLLYNTLDGAYIITSDSIAIDFVEEMHQKKNLGVVELTEQRLNNPALAQFASECCKKNICRLQEQEPNQPKPVQLMPVLNLQRDVEKLKEDPGRSVGEGIMDYLTDVTIILNRNCRRNCPECGNFNRQFFHCSKGEGKHELDAKDVIGFLETIRYAPLRRLAFTGGDIFSYSQWDKLKPYLDENGICPILGIHYQNITEACLVRLGDFPLEIFVPSPINKDVFSEKLSLIGQREAKYIFSVTSEEDCAAVEDIVEEHHISKCEFAPFYDKKNLDFFKKQVFTTREDILESTISQRVIFARQKMNTNFFGQVVIFPNGDLKANPNGSTLGNIRHDHIAKMLEKELVGTESWRCIRNNRLCSECLFQFLCPSPSNYEIVMERDNLCTDNNG